MPTTSPDNISYPSNTDPQKTIEERIQDTAESVQSAFNTVSKSHNYIINGAMDINQRGLTSTGVTTQQYTLDRWLFAPNSGTVTQSYQLFTPGSGPASSVEAIGYLRTVTSGQSAAGAFTIINNNIEDVRALAGKVVTISFYAKSSVNGLAVAHEFSQNYGTEGSPSSPYDVPIPSNGSSKFTLTTSWARYSYTMTLPSLSGKTLGTTADTSFTVSRFWLSAGSDFNARTSSLGIQNGTIDLWGMQIEDGSSATPFRRNSPSIQAELAACQRYYWRFTQVDNYQFWTLCSNWGGELMGALKLPVTMRVRPSLSISNLAAVYWLGNNTNYTGATGFSGRPSKEVWAFACSTASVPTNVPVMMRPAVGTFIEASAEL